MGYNSKELRVSKDPKKPSKPKDTDYVSKMGYRDDSPFRNQEAINIYTPNGTIDMSNTDIPLMANGRYLPPYSGQHQFDTTNVLEQRMASGGEVDADKAYSFLVAKSIYGHPLSAAQTKAFERIAGVQVDENGDIIEDEEGEDVSDDNEDTEDMSYEKRGGSTRGKKTSKNIKTSVNKLLQRNAMLYGPSDKNTYDPNFKTGGWLDKAQDGKIQLQDKRFLDPISGNPLKQGNRKGYAVDSALVDDIIQTSYKSKIDPNTMLAKGLQESGLGQYDNYFGDNESNWSSNDYLTEQGRHNMVVNAINLTKKKDSLAKSLGKTKDEDVIQAWNGYGRTKSTTPLYGLSKDQFDTKQVGSKEFPVTQYSLDMNKNPVYGKTVVNLRDSVIAQNPQIQAMVKKYAPAEPKPKPVVNYPYAPTYGKNPQAQPYDYSSTGKGLAKQQMGGWLDQYQTAGATGPKFDRSLMVEMSMPSETVQSQVAPLPYMLTSSKDPVKDFKKSKLVQQSKEQEQARIKMQGTLSQGYAEGDPRNPNFIEEPYYAALQNRPVGEHGSLALQNQMSAINQLSPEMYLTPPGMVAGVLQGGYELPKNVREGNYGDALINLLQIAPGAKAFPKGYGKAMDYLAGQEGLNEAQIALGQQMRKTLPGAVAELYHVGKYYRPGKETLMPYVEKIGNVMKKPLNELLFSGNRVPVAEGIANYNPLKALGQSNLLGLSTALSAAKAADHFSNTTLPEMMTLHENPTFDKAQGFVRNLGADAINLIPALNTKVSDAFAPGNWSDNSAIHNLERFLAGKLIKDPIKSEVKYAEKKKGGASNEWLPVDHYQDGGITVRELWENTTGTPWKEAAARGLTDGSYEMNMQLRKLLLGERAQMPVSHPAALPANAIHAPVRQQVAAKVQQAPMPRIDPSLMGRVYNPSETVQSQRGNLENPIERANAPVHAARIEKEKEDKRRERLIEQQKMDLANGQGKALWDINAEMANDKAMEEHQAKINHMTNVGMAGLAAAPFIAEAIPAAMAGASSVMAIPEVSGAINAAMIYHGIKQAPETVKAWTDPTISKWDAAGQTALNVMDFAGIGYPLKAIAEASEVAKASKAYNSAYTGLNNIKKNIISSIEDAPRTARNFITKPFDSMGQKILREYRPEVFNTPGVIGAEEIQLNKAARKLGTRFNELENPEYLAKLRREGYGPVKVETAPAIGDKPAEFAIKDMAVIERWNQKAKLFKEANLTDKELLQYGRTRKEVEADYLESLREPTIHPVEPQLGPFKKSEKFYPKEKPLDLKNRGMQDLSKTEIKNVMIDRGANPLLTTAKIPGPTTTTMDRIKTWSQNKMADLIRKNVLKPSFERNYMPLPTEEQQILAEHNKVLNKLFGNERANPIRDIDAVKAFIKEQPRGYAFMGSGSLSDSSFPLYTMHAQRGIMANEIKPVFTGYAGLNESGHLFKYGAKPELRADFINKSIQDFNASMGGKYKLPPAYVDNGVVMYPQMSLIKKELGGQSMPYVHYRLGGGWLDQYQVAGQVPIMDIYGPDKLTPRIDASLMGQPNFASETVQSQAPMSKYAAAEQNKAAVKSAIEGRAETVYNQNLQRQDLKKKYPTKNQEEIQRIQDKIESPWFNEPSGQLASYITRFHGLTDDELGDITGSGTMGNRLGVAANMAGWGLANELGGKLIGKGLEYASPYIEKGLGYIGGKLAKYLPKEINPVVGEQLQRLEGLAPVPPPPTYEQYAASNLDPVSKEVYERFNRIHQSGRTPAPVEQTPMNRVLTERWGNQANLVDPSRRSPYYNNRQVEIPRNFATELEGDVWMQAMEHNLGNDPQGYMNRALTNKYGANDGVMALQNQVRSQTITPVEGYNRLHNALRAESNNYHNWTTTAETSNPVSRPAASYKPEIASLKEVKNVDKAVIDKVDKYMQRPVITTGYQSYDTNSILGKVERVTSTSSIPKTAEIPDLITSFEKVYEKVKGKNTDLERKLRVQLEDLRGTNWLRTTGKAELEAQGLKPKELAIIDSGRGQVKNLVDKEGNIVGTITLSGSDSPVVSATGVNYKFHGYKLKDANAVKEAEAQLSERLLKDKATREALAQDALNPNPEWSQGIYDELMSPEYSNLYKPEAEKTLAQLLDNNQNRYGDMLYRGVHHAIKDTRGPLESHAHFVQTTLPDAISNAPKTLYRGQNYWESGIKRGTHELTPNGALRVVRKSGGEGWLDNY